MSITIASYGGGTNSTAMLIECVQREITVDLILFADTGGEKPETYKYIQIFSAWLVKQGMPKIVQVQTTNIHGTYITLEQKCREQHMLPSLAYGFKSCSEKHKIRPQNKYVNHWQPAIDAWAGGEQVQKLIGYDADESHRTKKDYSDSKYLYWYPLVEWNMGRDECVQTIRNAGLTLPGKSACFYCPSSRPQEIRQLKREYPHLAERALEMEAFANLTSVRGLGRSFAWRDVLAQQDMFDDDALPPELACGCYDG